MRLIKQAIIIIAALSLVGSAYAVGTGTLDKASGWYEAGTALTVNAEPGLNSEFTEWQGTNGTDVINSQTQLQFNVTGPRDITAVFSHILWDVVASVTGNGSITPSGTTQVPQSSNQTYTITADANHHISDVEIDGVSIGATNSYTFTNVTSNRTIEAFFAIDQFEVVFDPGVNGTLGSGSLTQTVDYASSATAPTITPNVGYKFDGWNSEAYTNVTADMTITAQYSLKEFTVAMNSPYGAGTPAVGSIITNTYGSSITASITNSPVELSGTTQYVCQGWARTGSEPGSGSGASTTFTLTNDTSITWSWKTNYYLTFGVQGN